MIPGGPTGAALALLLGAFSSGTPAPQPVGIPADQGPGYALRESADRHRLLILWQGSEQVLGECQDRLLQRSQRRGLEVSVIERNCGATVDYATQVIVRGRNFEEPVAVLQGRPQIRVGWNGRRLQIVHSPLPREHVFRQLSRIAGIGISHVELGPAATPTARSTLEDSSRNYGAHGRALGLPDELLLRWAGWAQQASGLYRGDWGQWQGAAPYGDDPSGRQKIIEGMQYHAEYSDTPGG
ncbi:MAG TPA: hypothetical protein VLI06_20560 [Solimonas sp.]|nr:hypothetical protein [Solimonas sp.]